MTELEKIEYAKSFIDKLANGINPIDGTAIPENDIVNNVRLSRCFFYVSDVLRQVIENGGYIPKNKTVTVPETVAAVTSDPPKKFVLTEELKSSLRISEVPLFISGITQYINTVLDLDANCKLAVGAINSWLMENGLLEEHTLSDGKKQKRPTALGGSCGIFTEERRGQHGPYTVMIYNAQAQQYIYDNLEEIINFRSIKNAPSIEPLLHQGDPWTEEQDKLLAILFKRGVSVNDISTQMKRSTGGIKARLKKLALIENRSDV